ncbi:cysteine protease [Favolaschia claudopus]|uniref:Cysteine protease n=1 Tax=Favolaschia claudopus TaxID=2862362 RepID=A0AAW0BXV0_9AGAR
MNTPVKALKTASSKSWEKAVQYLFDTDSTPDKCEQDIWLLGVKHPGWVQSDAIETTQGQSQNQDSASGHHWPPQFYSDFRTRIWCTYRRDFDAIDGGPRGFTSDAGWGCMLRTGQSLLANALLSIHSGRDWRRPPGPPVTRSSFFLPTPNSSPKSTHRRKHSIPSSPPFSPTATSNSSSSMGSEDRARHAAYVRLLTWFLDSPAPEAPFSVHRMALAGKDLGTEVGQWFGPSIAAGAIKTLVHAFPACGLGVSVATDGVLYQTSVFDASHTSPNPDTESDNDSLSWGDRPVLLLLGLRLGLDGVNPIYYDTIKQLYTFPQSVGIAGGRPSSSLYFVAAQAEGLFYLDPHHSRPAVPLRPPPKTNNDQDTDEAAEQYYASAYSQAELQTFHCEKVRKMHLSGLDPSMLVGFLCRDAEEWTDFRKRVSELPRAIFSVQEEPPSWPSVDLGGDEEDDSIALESIASSDDPSAASPPPISSSAVSSVLTPIDTIATSKARISDEPQSPWSSIDVPPRPERVNSDDSVYSMSNGNIGKGRLSFAMEGFRNKLRSFGRSRTSLPLTKNEA